MLELKNINKIYGAGSRLEVQALTDINLTFRDCEFVSVLGPSGCGKTTLLNLIGGLDRYTSGEITVDGKKTSDFTPRDWDTYRNHRVGFVFQSYNLIPHLNVLENVSLALALSGFSAEERKERAMQALLKVGLENHLRKKPNQLSGGEMQRVAIARAIVNDPGILLADEPTGALDSRTGVSIMELLKEISKDRLVVMVTHNDSLANTYSTRIVRLSDSRILSDSNPYNAEKEAAKTIDLKAEIPGREENKKRLTKGQYQKLKREEKKRKSTDQGEDKKDRKTLMSMGTALSLSFKNLMTKKARTVLMSVASSIGIVGLALVLALFNGLNVFLEKVQQDTLSTYPMSVVSYTTNDYAAMLPIITDPDNYKSSGDKRDKIFISHLMTELSNAKITNVITKKYRDYLENMPETYDGHRLSGEVRSIRYSYGTHMNIFKKKVCLDTSCFITEEDRKTLELLSLPQYVTLENVEVPVGNYFKEIVGDEDFVLSQYDLVAGRYPTKATDLVLVLDRNNRIPDTLISAFMIDINASKKVGGDFVINEYEYDDFLRGRLKRDENGNVREEDDKDLVTFTLALNKGLYEKSKEEGKEDYFEKKICPASWKLSRKDGENKDMSKIFPDIKTAEKFTNRLKAKGLNLPSCYNGKTDSGTDAAYTMDLRIVGILRLNDKTTTGSMGISPIGYTPALSQKIREEAEKSDIVLAQRKEYEEISGGGECRNLLLERKAKVIEEGEDAGVTEYEFSKRPQIATKEEYETAMRTIGYPEFPNKIEFYAKSFEGKKVIKKYLADYNRNLKDDEKIFVTDIVGTVIDVLKVFIDTIVAILLSLTAISLIVAAIMIAIITYVSVIERTREIGILRSIGARKLDIANVFNAETIIIGVFAGVLGIVFAFLLQFPLNALLFNYTGISHLAALSPLHGLILVLVSVVITLLSGAIPAIMASKRDPVKALRSE